MSTYCAPCLADLALLREAVTTVSGTASCVAHAVLLLHPGDSAQQRLARLSELRSTAEGKIATASADDIPALELLVQEYALAGAMDMTVPLRDLAGERTPRPEGAAKKRRNRGRDRDRGPRPDRPEGTGEAGPAADSAPAEPSAGEGAAEGLAPSAESAPAEPTAAPAEPVETPAATPAETPAATPAEPAPAAAEPAVESAPAPEVSTAPDEVSAG